MAPGRTISGPGDNAADETFIFQTRCQNKNTQTVTSKRARLKKKQAYPPPTESLICKANWATVIRMKCLRIPTQIFRSLGRIPSTAESVNRLLGACFLGALLGAAPPSNNYPFRLSPGPRLVGTRADRSGGGSATATLTGDELTLNGSFSGLLAVPTGAHLLMGSLPGVRGPVISDLTVSPETSGTLSGTVRLNSAQLAAFHKGGLYVEIDSDKAPEGDLWGWILPR
jgi:hypothetical protein